MKKQYHLAAVIFALLLATGCQKHHIAAELVDGQTFNALIPRNATAVVFDYNSSVRSGKELSTTDSPVPIFGNLEGTTWKVSTSADMINANPDCALMFKCIHYDSPGRARVIPPLKQIDFGKGFYTDNVTNMSGMFEYCDYLKRLDLSNFNTKRVTNMRRMFCGCYALTSLDISHFNTENVADMNSMFAVCHSLKSLDLSNFNTENVTHMASMFAVCQNLTSLDLSHFNTEKVTDMNNMFFMCQNLTSLDLSHFNTEKVTNMNNMFAVCNRLTSLDLSHFDMSRGVNKDGMCYGLSTISKHCTITCTDAVQTALQNGTELPTPEEGVTFTWVRPTSK